MYTPTDAAGRQEPAEPGRHFVTASDLAEWTGISERTIRAAFARGELDGATQEAGRGRWRAPYESAVAWARSRQKPARPDLLDQSASGGGDQLDTAVLEKAVDRARIVELERDVIRTERDALKHRVRDLEQRITELRADLTAAQEFSRRLAAVIADTGSPPRPE